MSDQKPNIAVLNELVDELIISTISDDNKLKELDKSIDPASISFSTHLAKTIKEFINANE
jgi:hypothetical protein